ncbi:MAG: Glucose-6-phosphate 1-dehydrogenase 2 [Phycisphaerae bacterium]|nr:Glucose-6-phosphate 1-dehydrogenase 2 [Phycisphaerae bacterium]
MSNPLRDSRHAARRADPCLLVIFGATGDLTARKIAPALWSLATQGRLPPGLAVVGYGRSELSDDAFRGHIAGAVKADPASDGWKDFADRLFYHRGRYDDLDSHRALGRRLAELRQGRSADNTLFYLATPASAFEPIIRALGDAGLVPGQAGWTRIIVEKPFGRDLASARQLNDTLGGVFGEANSFRIDHYLGKETVQNLLVLRFANAIFELMWNREQVDHVQITAAEQLGVEQRAGFFEQTGILRDIAQNHLMQLLCLTAMEPPAAPDADAIRDEKVKVIRSLRRLTARDVVAGQYGPGAVEGRSVPGYREEPDVAADSSADTFLAMRAYVDNWRWAGVPFYLRCGKRLARKVTEIAIQFRRPPLSLFAQLGVDRLASNRLVIRVQPDEGISLLVGSKIPGPEVRIQPVKMDFRYGTSFGGRVPDAYERLVLDVMAGDATLFTRRDEVEQAWNYFAPILDAWERGDKSVVPYPAGSWGPADADRLLVSPEHAWRRL